MTAADKHPDLDLDDKRLEGIRELLATSDFDHDGRLNNDDARWLVAENTGLRVDLASAIRMMDRAQNDAVKARTSLDRVRHVLDRADYYGVLLLPDEVREVIDGGAA